MNHICRLFVAVMFLVMSLVIFSCNEKSDSGLIPGDEEQEAEVIVDGDLDSSEVEETELSDQLTDGDEEHGESEEEAEAIEQGLPDKLEVHLDREPVGEPLTEQELKDSALAITGLWKETNYFQWLNLTSHGLAKDNQWGYPDYKFWWQNTVAVKEGDTVTFKHVGGADNIMERTCRSLIYSMAGYHATGDEQLKQISISWLRGVRGLYDANIWGNEDPPIDTIMARGFFSHNHEYIQTGNRRTVIDYEPVKFEDIARRHDTFHNPNNPTWGDIWVRTKRSKDDLPWLYRMVPLMMRIAENSKDEEFVEEVNKTIGRIRAFAKDVLDHNYCIRIKDQEGNPSIPMYGDIIDDYASFINYDEIWPLAECTSKLSTAFAAIRDDGDNQCENGSGGGYELFTIASHYWSTALIQYFHISALASALIEGHNDTALALIAGLAERADKQIHDDEGRETTGEWDSDAASFLIISAAYGLPLTAEEARFVHTELLEGAEHYKSLKIWDMWDSELPDGEYDYIPTRYYADERPNGQNEAFRVTEINSLLEYCESPFKDPESQPFVDCSIILDPANWAQKK